MKIEFTKMHGAGNDYVYVDCTKEMLLRHLRAVLTLSQVELRPFS